MSYKNRATAFLTYTAFPINNILKDYCRFYARTMHSETKTFLNRSASVHVVIKYLKKNCWKKGVGAGEDAPPPPSPTHHQY